MRIDGYIDSKQQLTPCPFCGCKTQLVIGTRIDFVDQEWYWRVECKDCHANVSGYMTERQAIDAWNRRFCKDDIEEDGYITWKHYRDRFVRELTADINGRNRAD